MGEFWVKQVHNDNVNARVKECASNVLPNNWGVMAIASSTGGAISGPILGTAGVGVAAGGAAVGAGLSLAVGIDYVATCFVYKQHTAPRSVTDKDTTAGKPQVLAAPANVKVKRQGSSGYYQVRWNKVTVPEAANGTWSYRIYWRTVNTMTGAVGNWVNDARRAWTTSSRQLISDADARVAGFEPGRSQQIQFGVSFGYGPVSTEFGTYAAESTTTTCNIVRR